MRLVISVLSWLLALVPLGAVVALKSGHHVVGVVLLSCAVVSFVGLFLLACFGVRRKRRHEPVRAIIGVLALFLATMTLGLLMKGGSVHATVGMIALITIYGVLVAITEFFWRRAQNR